MNDKLLELRQLTKHYPIFGGILRRPVNSVKAVDGVNLTIHRGECLGLVGESGCGKTTTGKAIVRLHNPTSGEMLFHPRNGEAVDIAAMPLAEMRRRGIRKAMQMVFQDPTSSLDPRMLVKHIIAEPMTLYERMSARDLNNRVIELLQTVGLSQDHLLRYPHEFSGGQRQRIAVARAIATNPEFIVMDEPTSALDVSVQAQILNLLKRLQEQFNLTYLFVSHHLLVVKYLSHRIAVMYLGKIVEIADSDDIFRHPAHPYTHALLSAIPIPDLGVKRGRIVLTGDVPSPINPPSGCRFHPRCPFAQEQCRLEEPALRPYGNESRHLAACHRQEQMDRLVHEMFGERKY
ncbi:oligopeptide/dipeptide ABC transporter, ATPase subunit [Candidatus Moduliflexus flocculans]|uniref:Oligopeptide/dipeptide ABC transporter, ATPase subunit n=1 Tax=Candidatus Moduliflexus flocculans TaxID=1499966 RepID=A0A081BP99_9BACT|nr:oligopeptide/dipeptide ABC transporter, ATPase subunit [Candidatus Moduliflexus flocculans]